ATEKDVALTEVDDFEAIPGHGIRAVISGQEIFVGTRKLMTDHTIDVTQAEEELTTYESDGKTAMLIAIDGAYRGIVADADTIKEKAKYRNGKIKDKDFVVIK